MILKRKFLKDVDQYRKQGSIISSNTSGISVEAMAEGRSDDFKKHFLGTHFFNPPRYLKLLEVIPTKHTDPEVLSFMKTVRRRQLGKGVVDSEGYTKLHCQPDRNLWIAGNSSEKW